MTDTWIANSKNIIEVSQDHKTFIEASQDWGCPHQGCILKTSVFQMESVKQSQIFSLWTAVKQILQLDVPN